MIFDTPYPMCVVGGIHQSETTPLKLGRLFTFDRKDREQTNPVRPNFDCGNHRCNFGISRGGNARILTKVVGRNFDLNFEDLLDH